MLIRSHVFRVSNSFHNICRHSEVSCSRLDRVFRLSPLFPSNTHRKMSFVGVERGTTNSFDYKIYFKNDKGPVSPLHDIPLYSDEASKTCNMIVEIPRWTNAKMEINLKEVLNPIKQDVKKGKLRYVANCFPHHGYIWNYGALPQTWENPDVIDEHTGQKGDNDPIDIMEIGSRVAKRGEVLQVKILGCIGLIDEGETDWKIISIDMNDPLAEQMKDITDVEKHFPGLMKATVEWLRIYKLPDGKPENTFAFNGEFKDRNFALKVIQDTHKYWTGLIQKDAESRNISCANTTLPDNQYTISVAEAEGIINKSPSLSEGEPPEDSVGKWHFLHLK